MDDIWYLTTPEKSPFKDSTWNIYNDGGGGQVSGFPPMGPDNPDLDTFVRDTNQKRTFKLNPAKTGIIMTTDYEGYTTANSTNTRMEFREQKSPGYLPASWSTGSGRHKMAVTTQVDRTDGNHVVIAQIHGASDDLTVFRVEGTTLWATHGDEAHGANLGTISLGQKIRVGFDVRNNATDFYVDFNPGTSDPSTLWVAGNKKHTYSASDGGCYFKAGNYLQRKGSAGSWTQVTLYNVVVSHAASANEDPTSNPDADPPTKTVLGDVQKAWFKDQITNATEPVIVVLSDTVWLGAATADDDEYFAYNQERQELISFITNSGKNVIRLAGDMHAVAVGLGGSGYKRVWQAAPFSNTPSVKGSGWSQLYPA